ncbi:hypothetical protein MNEG_6705 [Monoraphidium neglectum]|uniref:S-acyltransferase n=1 Tax=Monoraphidium neglectum TaxID=145388 RepID=A0A0D2JQB0_9CHLO|nr:hypothetical protein MNEG_6705 [Monoraphidium neglectum]KIZ01258.1 hypothetical protein MNEG_6705 [Monoraphidium neglectum]|eukprot:XP_013900277.1 hypothetical protein MNEG_6705 [Monoraphidium neglectum]
MPRPGRSCVARLDHHCGWINACVGLHNTRHFLAFLVSNLVLCAYAAAVCCAAISGDLRRRGVLDIYVFDRQLGRLVPVAQRPARVLEYVAVFYGVAAAAGMFNAVCALLLAGFLAYQLSIIAAGTTTYEAAKLRELAAVRRRGGGGADAGVGAGAVTALAGSGAAAAAARA